MGEILWPFLTAGDCADRNVKYRESKLGEIEGNNAEYNYTERYFRAANVC